MIFLGGVGLLEIVWTCFFGYQDTIHRAMSFEKLRVGCILGGDQPRTTVLSVLSVLSYLSIAYVKGLDLQSCLVKFSKETLTILAIMFFCMINVHTCLLQGCLLTTSKLCCLSLPKTGLQYLHLNLTTNRIYVYIHHIKINNVHMWPSSSTPICNMVSKTQWKARPRKDAKGP